MNGQYAKCPLCKKFRFLVNDDETGIEGFCEECINKEKEFLKKDKEFKI